MELQHTKNIKAAVPCKPCAVGNPIVPIRILPLELRHNRERIHRAAAKKRYN